MSRTVLTTEPLSRSDMLDLLELLPPDAAEQRVVDLPPGELGEPVTVVLLVTLTMSALTGISAWLASRGKDVEFSMGIEVPGIKASGSFKARSGDSADKLAQRAREAGAEVPSE